MGQPESQQSGKVGWGRTCSREEWEEEQKSKYWHESAQELPGTWAVPFPIHPSTQPFPLLPFPSHLGPCTAAQGGAHIPGCVHQVMVQPGTPRTLSATSTITTMNLAG